MFVAFQNGAGVIDHAFQVTPDANGWRVDALFPDLSGTPAPSLDGVATTPPKLETWEYSLGDEGAPAILVSVHVGKDGRGDTAYVAHQPSPGVTRIAPQTFLVLLATELPEAVAFRDAAEAVARKFGNQNALKALTGTGAGVSTVAAVASELGRLVNATATTLLKVGGLTTTNAGRGSAVFTEAFRGEEASADIRVLAAMAHGVASPYGAEELLAFQKLSAERRQLPPAYFDLARAVENGDMEKADPARFTKYLKQISACGKVPRGMVVITVQRLRDERVDGNGILTMLANRNFTDGQPARLREVAIDYLVANPSMIHPVIVAAKDRGRKGASPNAVQCGDAWMGWTGDTSSARFAATENDAKAIAATAALLAELGIQVPAFRGEVDGDLVVGVAAANAKADEEAALRRAAAEVEAQERREIKQMEAEFLNETAKRGVIGVHMAVSSRNGVWEVVATGTCPEGALRIPPVQADSKSAAWRRAAEAFIQLADQPRQPRPAAVAPVRASRFGMLAAARRFASPPPIVQTSHDELTTDEAAPGPRR